MLLCLRASAADLVIAAPTGDETISTKFTAPLKTWTVKAGEADAIAVFPPSVGALSKGGVRIGASQQLGVQLGTLASSRKDAELV